jgi:phosphatidylinositol-3-phosphatase
MIRRAKVRLQAVVAAIALSATGVLLPLSTASAASAVPRFDHVVIMVMENKNYGDIIGRPDEAPYLSSLAAGGAVLSNSYAVAHPASPTTSRCFPVPPRA